MNNMPMNNMPMNNEVNAEANEVNAANFEDDVNVEQVVEGFANSPSSNGNGNGNSGNNRAEVSSHDMSNSSPQDVNFSNNSANNNNCLPRDVLNPEDLLPSVAPNNWDTPANPGGIDGPNFLNPEHLVGINTVGQSLRNANRQLRSEPANPQVKVSPWLVTTIEPDTNRKPLEIGECA